MSVTENTSRATPHNSARSISQNFCPNSKFQKWWNTVCISHFRNCGSGAKRRLRLEDAIVRCCPILWHKSIDKEVLSSLQNRRDESAEPSRVTAFFFTSLTAPPISVVLPADRSLGHAFLRRVYPAPQGVHPEAEQQHSRRHADPAEAQPVQRQPVQQLPQNAQR